jgi:hypothetical protein
MYSVREEKNDDNEIESNKHLCVREKKEEEEEKATRIEKNKIQLMYSDAEYNDKYRSDEECWF